jgi:hypothetical protein
MQGALKTVLATLQRTREGVLPSIQAFPPLDLDQIATSLALDKHAAENGASGQPAPDATDRDLAEFNISTEIEQRARKAQEDYQSQVDLRNGRIRRALIDADSRVEVEGAGQTALSDFNALAMIDRDHVFLTHREVEGREAEYQAFRRQHALNRLPRIVSPREKLFRWLVLVLCLGGESVLNGLYFAEGSESGLIGGFIQAMSLSIFNIGAAVLFALYGLALLRHRRVFTRSIGIFCLIAYIIWAGTINLVIAHYRDAFISLEGKVDLAPLLKQFWLAPLALRDMASLMLCGLGLLFSLIAVIDAKDLDDPYRGYGAVGRSREEAINRYSAEKRNCILTLGQRRDEAIADMGEIVKALRSAEFDLRLNSEGRDRDHRLYVAYIEELATCHEKLVRRYREANQRARSSTPAPSYFVYAPVRPAFLNPPPISPMPDLAPDARAQAIAHMEHYMRAINEAFSERLEGYEAVTTITSQQGPALGTA